MTKVLQIRRGNTVANNNFTGLAGEITMDTDKKTLRIHDGATLGGYALARADSIPAGFDINAVPDAFWISLFNRFRPSSITSSTADSIAISSNAYTEYIFNLSGATPLFAQAFLVCTSADAGYVVGDKMYSFGIGTHSATAPNIFVDTNGVHVRLITGGAPLWVPHAETGANTNISTEKWRIVFRIFY